MPDYPHRGPTISRIQLEGVGGFIYALTPVLILLFTAPFALLAWVAAGAALAPLIHWRSRTRARSLTNLAGGLAGFLVGLALTLATGNNRFFRLFALTCVAGGLLAAVVLPASSRSCGSHRPRQRQRAARPPWAVAAASSLHACAP